jgi:two-component system chemotaxis sensor kinase CheA
MKKTSQRKVLVVEDETSIATIVQKSLHAQNISTCMAKSFEEAMNCLDTANIGAIWLDHKILGKLTGMDFLAELKNHDEWSKIPVFVVTNSASTQQKHAYMELGVEKYFIKAQVKLDNVIQSIKKAMNIHGQV